MPSTKDVRQAVQAELASDPLVEADGIRVKNLSGDVALDGTVPSYKQYLEAVEATWRIPGVTSVHNHLAVALPPENYRDDARLTAESKNALANGPTGLERVTPTVKYGNVTLTGMVRYRRQRAAAVAAVSGLTGVRNVNDKVELGAEVDPADVNQLVKRALDRHHVAADDRHVTAEITGSTVTLLGHVRTSAQRDAVIAAAWLGYGVAVVIDEMEITG